MTPHLSVQPRLSMPLHQQHPLRIHVRRNGAVESVHDVDLALVDPDGKVIVSCGDIESPIFPRSAMKPLQSIALIEHLIQNPDHDDLTSEEVALICASHNAEDFHVEAVRRLLSRFEISDDALTCGAHWSLDQATSLAQARALDMPTKAHNNCSGKHAGMLVLGHLMLASLSGYAALTHPVQQRILGVLEAMTGADLMQHPHGVDGCGAPALSGPLGHWARGFALFADPVTLPDHRQEAIQRIRRSIAEAPLMIAGTGRACSVLAEVYGDQVTVKTGAEGVFAAAFHSLGLGLMLKARDGHKRASEFALGAVFHALGYDGDRRLDPFFNPVLKNWAGDEVGDIILAPDQDFTQPQHGQASA